MKCIWLSALLMIGTEASTRLERPLSLISPNQPFMFAVMGDNRGDESGNQPAAFLEVLEAINRESPSFVLDTGDMIYGHSTDQVRVRAMWKTYQQALSGLRAPMFHVPGNHDVWDADSAAIYRELWGPSYYAFDYGNSMFVGLDTETATNRIDESQFHWLEQKLEYCKQTNVFIFLHRPLFPAGPGIGSSLDVRDQDRDRLHQLFVKHRDRIRGVFAGHEHMFHFQPKDSVPYYITGGGGAPLYVAPELGGFHHFLCVRVNGSRVSVELKKVCAPAEALRKPKRIAPGDVLETWTQGLFWYAWDRTASIELTSSLASQGQRALRLNFDLAQYAWPVLALAQVGPWDFSKVESVSVDVFLPKEPDSVCSITPAVQSVQKHEGPASRLKSGWNTVTVLLDNNWLPESERRQVRGLEWSLSTDAPKGRGYVVFDNLRSHARDSAAGDSSELLEDWERPLLWRVFDETVLAEIKPRQSAAQTSGLVLHMDWSTCKRPVLLARLNPPWNLANVKALQLDFGGDWMPDDLTIELALSANDNESVAPPLRLSAANRPMKFDLDGDWLPKQTRARVDQIAFTLVSGNTNRPADLVFTRLTGL